MTVANPPEAHSACTQQQSAFPPTQPLLRQQAVICTCTFYSLRVLDSGSNGAPARLAATDLTSNNSMSQQWLLRAHRTEKLSLYGLGCVPSIYLWRDWTVVCRSFSWNGSHTPGFKALERGVLGPFVASRGTLKSTSNTHLAPVHRALPFAFRRLPYPRSMAPRHHQALLALAVVLTYTSVGEAKLSHNIVNQCKYGASHAVNA